MHREPPFSRAVAGGSGPYASLFRLLVLACEFGHRARPLLLAVRGGIPWCPGSQPGPLASCAQTTEASPGSPILFLYRRRLLGTQRVGGRGWWRSGQAAFSTVLSPTISGGARVLRTAGLFSPSPGGNFCLCVFSKGTAPPRAVPLCPSLVSVPVFRSAWTLELSTRGASESGPCPLFPGRLGCLYPGALT